MTKLFITYLTRLGCWWIDYLGFRADGLFYGTGTQTDVAANGDTTITTFDWTLDVSVPQAQWVVRATWKVVGVTGQLNATGHGTGEGRFNAAGNLVGVWSGVVKIKINFEQETGKSRPILPNKSRSGQRLEMRSPPPVNDFGLLLSRVVRKLLERN